MSLGLQLILSTALVTAPPGCSWAPPEANPYRGDPTRALADFDCADDACVIVPTICNNVSLVTRKPEREAVLDDTPIDISPAAGPPPPASCCWPGWP